METHNTHGADGSFLGFLFQIERVMLWLSEGGEGRKVGIETDDDIVVQIQKGTTIETIYEQAKNAQGGRIPFSDQSEDLWKTLSIWITAVKEGRIIVNTAIFSAITNKKLPKGRLLLKLSSAFKEDMTNMSLVIKELKETASKLSTENKKFGDVVLNCDEKILIDIIHNIIVLDGSYHHEHNEFKRKLKANLSLGNKLPFDHIYNNLLGAVTNKIIDFWRKGEEAWIDVDSFNNQYNQLVAEFHKKSFLEKATDFLPVSKNDIDKNLKQVYVEQLKAIDCNEEEQLEAIHDYLRAKSEKSRYAKEFEVLEPKFVAYYDDLRAHWTKISRPRFKINPQNLRLEQIGYQVYYETIIYKGKLNNQEPEQSYTYKGAYHHLANEQQLGWHPEWKTNFNKAVDGEDK
jgi:hypothetical protein